VNLYYKIGGGGGGGCGGESLSPSELPSSPHLPYNKFSFINIFAQGSFPLKTETPS